VPGYTLLFHDPKQELIREFFIAKKVWTINFGDERRLIYYEEEQLRRGASEPLRKD